MTTATSEKKRRGGSSGRSSATPSDARPTTWSCRALLIILVVAFFPILYRPRVEPADSTVTGFGPFVGVENYVEMFQNPDFLEGLTNTVIFTVVSVALEFVIGLGIALAINRAFGAEAWSGPPSWCHGRSRRSSRRSCGG